MARTLGAIAAVLFALVVTVAAGALVWRWWSERGAVHDLAKAEQRAGDATVAAGAARAETAATKIVVAGERRDQLTIHVQQENDRAIASAPGASAPVDPGLNDAGRRGLCRFAAYRDDPDCHRLLEGDPAALPGAHRGDADAPF